MATLSSNFTSPEINQQGNKKRSAVDGRTVAILTRLSIKSGLTAGTMDSFDRTI
jgi:hypothetical protein